MPVVKDSLKNRVEFLAILDVTYGSLNGDPDTKAPRIDNETGISYATPQCIKRFVRDYVMDKYAGKEGMDILIQNDRTLEDKYLEGYTENGIKPPKDKESKSHDELKMVRDFACENYFDVRVFGDPMASKKAPGLRVRGPVQLSFARSYSPVRILDMAITREAKSNEERAKKSGDSEMGDMCIIPYGLYHVEGFVSPSEAESTGMTEKDLDVFFEALLNGFDTRHSTTRGDIQLRKLIVFKHDEKYGNAHSSELFKHINITLKEGVEHPQSFDDYKVGIDKNMPDGVEMIELL